MFCTVYVLCSLSYSNSEGQTISKENLTSKFQRLNKIPAYRGLAQLGFEQPWQELRV